MILCTKTEMPQNENQARLPRKPVKTGWDVSGVNLEQPDRGKNQTKKKNCDGI